MNKIILNRVNLDGFKLNPIGKQVDKKDFEYLVVDREFKFDKTAGGKTIKDGTARIETIKGNSVVWNQLINETYLEANDATITKTDTGYTIVPTGNAPGLRTNAANGKIIPIVGHKYAIICEKVGGSRAMYLNWGGFNTSLTSPIITATDATKTQLTIYSYKETETFTITTPLLIDLTLMFGAGKEPSTIEEFNARKPIVEDEYAYNEGEVIHMDVQSIESVGVNQWDEEWEQGGIASASGLPITLAGAIRSKNFSPALPSTSYYVNGAAYTGDKYIFFYDREQGFISRSYFTSNEAVNTPSNAAYFKIRIDQGSSFHKDICINISDPSINGKYFPYVKREQNLDIIGKYFPDGMKSAGTAHDEIRYNKTTQKWESVKRIGSVDLGTLEWEYVENASVGKLFTGHRILAVNISNRVLHICAKYTPMRAYIIYGDLNIDKIITIEDGFQVRVKDSSYTDAASFKAAMAGVMLYYELAEPIVAEIDETINLDYPVWNVGTEKADANVPSTPLKADIRYKILKNKLKLMTLNI